MRNVTISPPQYLLSVSLGPPARSACRSTLSFPGPTALPARPALSSAHTRLLRPSLLRHAALRLPSLRLHQPDRETG